MIVKNCKLITIETGAVNALDNSTEGRINRTLATLKDRNLTLEDSIKKVSENASKGLQDAHEHLTDVAKDILARLKDVDKKHTESRNITADAVNKLSFDIAETINTIGNKIDVLQVADDNNKDDISNIKLNINDISTKSFSAIDENKSKIELINNKIISNKEEINKLESSVDAIKPKIESFEKDLMEMEINYSDALRGVVPQVRSNSQKISYNVTSINEHSAKIQAIESDNKKLNDLISNLKVNNGNLDKAEIDAINEQIKALATKLFTEIDYFKNVDLDTTAKIDNIKETINELKDKDNSLKSLIDNIQQTDLTPINDKVDSLEAQIAKIASMSVSQEQIDKIRDAVKQHIHIAWSQYENGLDRNGDSEITKVPENAKWVGIKVSDDATAPTNANEYQWFPTGFQTKYPHVVLSNYADGNNERGVMDTGYDPEKPVYVGIAYSDSPIPSGIAERYTWARLTGLNHNSNTRLYHWFVFSKYQNGKDSKGNPNFTDLPENAKYMGFRLNDPFANKPENPDMYLWVKIGTKGEKGDAGITNYTFLRFSEYEDGESSAGVSSFTDKPSKKTKYIGFSFNNQLNVAPVEADDYFWYEIPAPVKGDKGDDGDSLLTHMVYSEHPDGVDPISKTMSFHKDPLPTDSYIGFRLNCKDDKYNLDNNQLYTWFLARGIAGKSLRMYIGFSDYYDGVDGQGRFAITQAYTGQRYMMITYNSLSLSPPTRPDSYFLKIDLGLMSGKAGGFSKSEIESICADISANYLAQTERKITDLEQRVDDLQNLGGGNGNGGSYGFSYIKYSEYPQGVDAQGNTAFTTDEDKKIYIGMIQNVTDSTPPEKANLYEWSRFRGKEQHIHMRFADTVDGQNMSGSPVGKRYMGFSFNYFEFNAPTDPNDYAWYELGKGESRYTHIVYSEFEEGKDSKGNSVFTRDKKKRNYIGICDNCQSATKPQDANHYTWSLLCPKNSSTRKVNELEKEVAKLKESIAELLSKQVVHDKVN